MMKKNNQKVVVILYCGSLAKPKSYGITLSEYIDFLIESNASLIVSNPRRKTPICIQHEENIGRLVCVQNYLNDDPKIVQNDDVTKELFKYITSYGNYVFLELSDFDLFKLSLTDHLGTTHGSNSSILSKIEKTLNIKIIFLSSSTDTGRDSSEMGAAMGTVRYKAQRIVRKRSQSRN